MCRILNKSCPNETLPVMVIWRAAFRNSDFFFDLKISFPVSPFSRLYFAISVSKLFVISVILKFIFFWLINPSVLLSTWQCHSLFFLYLLEYYFRPRKLFRAYSFDEPLLRSFWKFHIEHFLQFLKYCNYEIQDVCRVPSYLK